MDVTSMNSRQPYQQPFTPSTHYTKNLRQNPKIEFHFFSKIGNSTSNLHRQPYQQPFTPNTYYTKNLQQNPKVEPHLFLKNWQLYFKFTPATLPATFYAKHLLHHTPSAKPKSRVPLFYSFRISDRSNNAAPP